MKEALVLMAKAPRVGEVKTRLLGALDATAAKDLYVSFLSDTFALMEMVWEARDELQLVLCYTPAGAEEAFEEIEREGSLMILQRGDDLGERLRNCFADLFAMGYEAVVIIGGDSPTLPDEYIFDAFECFESDDDVVIGPTEDQGYYLIGLRRLHEAIFNNIPWSTDGVLPATIEQIEKAELNLTLLPEWYDVDTPEELARLRAELQTAKDTTKHTRRFLKELAKKES